MTAGEGTIDPEWERRHKAFHEALYAACGSPWLIHLCGLLFDRAGRYLRLLVENNGTSRDVVKEHTNLLRAAMDRVQRWQSGCCATGPNLDPSAARS
jgi:DNA-binding GntR family transcriptional regulator